MLRSRLSVFLMLHKGNLYKSEKFKNYTYIGDPINAVRIYNDFEVDEIILVDIDASRLEEEPRFDIIERVASESRMPLCYGGGVKNLFHVEEIIKLGVEKISLSSEAIYNPGFIKSASNLLGSQSIVCCLDVKKMENNSYSAYTYNGTKKVNSDITSILKSFAANGAGEIIVNNIDRDGTMLGYDEELIKNTIKDIDLPFTFVGGAKDLKNTHALLNQFGIFGMAGGRVFSLIGERKSVLLNYPNRSQKEKFINL